MKEPPIIYQGEEIGNELIKPSKIFSEASDIETIIYTVNV